MRKYCYAFLFWSSLAALVLVIIKTEADTDVHGATQSTLPKAPKEQKSNDTGPKEELPSGPSTPLEVYVRNTPKSNTPKETLQICLRGLRWYPKSCRLTRRAMYAYFKMGKIDMGLAYYRLLAHMQCENSGILRDTLIKLRDKMSTEDFIEFGNAYLDINPTANVLHEYVAKSYMSIQKWRAAKHHFWRALETKSTKSQRDNFYYSIGVCNKHLGEYEKALKYMKKAKKLGKSFPERFLNEVRSKINKSK